MKNKKNFNWENRRVLITGGASFIGSHLTDALLSKKAKVRVVDSLVTGKIKNISKHLKNNNLEFIKADLCDPGVASKSVKGIQTVFHLAADHGGRGYVDLHQAGPASNMFLDGLVFWEAVKSKVEKIVFASSGCVYPNYLQTDSKKKMYLTEDLVKAPYDADNMYGWAKLMGEKVLKAYSDEGKIKSASCRYFTVYGPRGKEDHAVIAMIARAFIRQNPFEVWGNGQQIRNWTYVDDIVKGTILVAEKIDDGTAVNLGTMERIKVIDAVEEIMNYTNFHSRIKFLEKMPTGPMNRVADNSLAKKLLNWKPQTMFKEGLHATIDWYFSNKKRNQINKTLEKKLTER